MHDASRGMGANWQNIPLSRTAMVQAVDDCAWGAMIVINLPAARYEYLRSDVAAKIIRASVDKSDGRILRPTLYNTSIGRGIGMRLLKGVTDTTTTSDLQKSVAKECAQAAVDGNLEIAERTQPEKLSYILAER